MRRNNLSLLDREIRGRHFVQTGKATGLVESVVLAAIEEMADTAQRALQKVESALPENFPSALHASVSKSVMERLDLLLVRAGAKGAAPGLSTRPTANSERHRSVADLAVSPLAIRGT